ncbi:hypothetical protein PoB_000902900 [Plakobranchus ocellatus]|uniref:Uncharacterized protein n=1 Tax=Plakobranchus ocellatus TaxID=259542 RepID=A0AAV3YKG3_9GAST|nr:hypothetical protein PoB_000902900 [Plakobranchus ocellatus]
MKQQSQGVVVKRECGRPSTWRFGQWTVREATDNKHKRCGVNTACMPCLSDKIGSNQGMAGHLLCWAPVAQWLAERSAGTLLWRVQAPPPSPWHDGEPERLSSPYCGLAILQKTKPNNKLKPTSHIVF